MLSIKQYEYLNTLSQYIINKPKKNSRKLKKKTIIRKTSLHLICEVSANIISGIPSSITSSAGPKLQDFILLVCFSIYLCGRACLNSHFIHPTFPSFG